LHSLFLVLSPFFNFLSSLFSLLNLAASGERKKGIEERSKRVRKGQKMADTDTHIIVGGWIG